MTLQIDGQLVCAVYVMDGKFHIIWDKLWESWQDLHADAESVVLLAHANAKLDKSSAGKGVGKMRSFSNIPRFGTYLSASSCNFLLYPHENQGHQMNISLYI